MKSVTVKLKIDPKKFEATQQFMEEKGLHIEMELSDSVDRFYEKYVPAPVRKYIERTTPIPPFLLQNPRLLPLVSS